MWKLSTIKIAGFRNFEVAEKKCFSHGLQLVVGETAEQRRDFLDVLRFILTDKYLTKQDIQSCIGEFGSLYARGHPYVEVVLFNKNYEKLTCKRFLNEHFNSVFVNDQVISVQKYLEILPPAIINACDNKSKDIDYLTMIIKSLISPELNDEIMGEYDSDHNLASIPILMRQYALYQVTRKKHVYETCVDQAKTDLERLINNPNRHNMSDDNHIGKPIIDKRNLMKSIHEGFLKIIDKENELYNVRNAESESIKSDGHSPLVTAKLAKIFEDFPLTKLDYETYDVKMKLIRNGRILAQEQVLKFLTDLLLTTTSNQRAACAKRIKEQEQLIQDQLNKVETIRENEYKPLWAQIKRFRHLLGETILEKNKKLSLLNEKFKDWINKLDMFSNQLLDAALNGLDEVTISKEIAELTIEIENFYGKENIKNFIAMLRARPEWKNFLDMFQIVIPSTVDIRDMKKLKTFLFSVIIDEDELFDKVAFECDSEIGFKLNFVPIKELNSIDSYPASITPFDESIDEKCKDWFIKNINPLLISNGDSNLQNDFQIYTKKCLRLQYLLLRKKESNNIINDIINELYESITDLWSYSNKTFMHEYFKHLITTHECTKYYLFNILHYRSYIHQNNMLKYVMECLARGDQLKSSIEKIRGSYSISIEDFNRLELLQPMNDITKKILEIDEYAKKYFASLGIIPLTKNKRLHEMFLNFFKLKPKFKPEEIAKLEQIIANFVDGESILDKNDLVYESNLQAVKNEYNIRQNNLRNYIARILPILSRTEKDTFENMTYEEVDKKIVAWKLEHQDLIPFLNIFSVEKYIQSSSKLAKSSMNNSFQEKVMADIVTRIDMNIDILKDNIALCMNCDKDDILFDYNYNQSLSDYQNLPEAILNVICINSVKCLFPKPYNKSILNCLLKIMYYEKSRFILIEADELQNVKDEEAIWFFDSLKNLFYPRYQILLELPYDQLTVSPKRITLPDHFDFIKIVKSEKRPGDLKLIFQNNRNQ